VTTSRTNSEWLDNLRATGAVNQTAIADLRALVLSGLPHALAGWLSRDNDQFEALVEDIAQETVLSVLAHLDSFEGRSQFTTWVHRIAVNLALTELRRRRWRDVSLDEIVSEGSQALMATGESAMSGDPQRAAEQMEMGEMIQRMIQEELTEKQRLALVAVSVEGMPLEEVARQMGTNRNALYKLLHDARVRLKARLEREGMRPEEILAAFESG
jgi:RNA polymerase sigma-70 factor (ECF subfamily)